MQITRLPTIGCIRITHCGKMAAGELRRCLVSSVYIYEQDRFNGSLAHGVMLLHFRSPPCTILRSLNVSFSSSTVSLNHSSWQTRSFCPQGLNVTEKHDTGNASLTPPWNHNELWRFPRLFSWWSTSRMQPITTDFCLLSIVVSGRRTSGAAGSSYIFSLKSRKAFQSRWKVRTYMNRSDTL